MKLTSGVRSTAAVATLPLMMLLGGCATPAPVVQLRDTYRPVVSLNQAMVAIVDHNSHILWNAAVDEYAPANDADWHELEHAAVALAAAGNIVLLGGSGAGDLAWVQKPDWAALTQRQTDVALAMMLAVEHKNRAELSKAGDDLAAACEACHKAYKPDLPAIVATPEQQPEHFYGFQGKAKGKAK